MIRILWGACLWLALVATATAAAEAQQLASEGMVPGTRIEVLDLKRDGATVTLRFQLINETQMNLMLTPLAASAGDWKQHYPHNLGDAQFGPGHVAISAVHLIDAANGKKYLVVRDTAKNCVCAVHYGNDLPPRQKLNLWAKFPAPPESVRKVSVIVPRFGPVDDVPITSR